MSLQKSSIILALAVFSAGTSNAVTSRSANYSFEYSAVGMGGGSSSSSDYNVVAYLDDIGSASPASSTDYTIEPAVGTAGPSDTSVDAWMLY